MRAATGLVGVRDDDLRGLGGGDVGVERADERDREPGAEKLGQDVGRDGARGLIDDRCRHPEAIIGRTAADARPRPRAFGTGQCLTERSAS